MVLREPMYLSNRMTRTPRRVRAKRTKRMTLKLLLFISYRDFEATWLIDYNISKDHGLGPCIGQHVGTCGNDLSCTLLYVRTVSVVCVCVYFPSLLTSVATEAQPAPCPGFFPAPSLTEWWPNVAQCSPISTRYQDISSKQDYPLNLWQLTTHRSQPLSHSEFGPDG